MEKNPDMQQKPNKTQTILGIDPGTQIMGYGLIYGRGNHFDMLTMGVVHLKKFTTTNAKLKQIYQRTSGLIHQYHPDALSIEAPFYGKNVQAMLKLGRAQGVAIAAALSLDVDIYEYTPRKIKQAITGNGNAAKEQVAGFLKSMLNIEEMPENLDATDGIAAAACHILQRKTPEAGKFKSWKDFINKNPNRLK